MRRKKWLGLAALAIAVCLVGSTARAQFAPNAWIQTDGWNFLFPILNPLGAGPPPAVMKQSWVAPHEIGLEDPKSGTNWNDIDFGGASPAPGYEYGGIDGGNGPIWYTMALLEGATGGVFPNGDLVNYQDEIVNVVNALPVPPSPVWPGDNVLGIATTYVNNTTGAPLLVNVCTASDDSIQVWVNNRCILNKSIPRGSAADCQERSPAFLPAGVSKIACLVWEGGGGHNFRLAIEDLEANKLADGNGMIAVLGPGAPGTVGQLQYGASRSTDLDATNCPPAGPVKITIRGDGSFGEPGDMVTVVETIDAASPASNSIQVTDITDGGVLTDEVITRPVGVNGAGFVENLLFLGPFDNAEGAGPTDAVLQDVQIMSTTNAAIDESDPNYRPAAGDTVPDNVRALVAAPANATINPGGVLTWNLRTGEANINFDSYYGGNVENNTVAMAFYMCLEAATDVYFGVGSDDSFSIRVDGTVVGFRSIPRGAGAANEIQDLVGPVALAAGKHFVIFKVYEGGGGHGGRIGVFDDTRKPLTGVEFSTSPAGDCDGTVPAARRAQITWETTRATLDGAGVMYRVFSGTGTTTHTGFVTNEAIVEGPNSLPFNPNASGQVGIFGNSHDIGAVPTLGSTTFDGTSYSISGSGADIWDGGDQFHFAYKKVTGDFDARVHVAGRSTPVPGTTWGRTGLMARWTCDTNSKYSMGTVSSSQNKYEPRLQWRVVHLNNGNTRNGTHVVNDGFFLSEGRAPTWQRLVRRGNGLYSYMGEDDGNGSVVEWKIVGSDNHVGAPDTMLVGFAVSSHGGAGANRDTVILDHVSIEPLAPDGGGACAPDGGPLQTLAYEDPADIGVVVVRGGAFTPAVANGRLKLTDDAVASSATAVWYGVPASSAAGGVPLLAEGFVAEFDAYMAKGAGGCDPAADPNPADGFTFAVVATSEDDALASAVGPFPPGLSVATLGGDGGGALGYDGGTLRERTECHANFSVELDNWVGGGEPANEPTDGGSTGFDCGYHVGLNVNGSVSSLQTNADFGVASVDLPNIFGAEGVHITVQYQPSGQIDVWADELHVLSYGIPPLPAGDVVLGFTGGTGGATAHQEVDNFSISSVCCEDAADTVMLSADTDTPTEGVPFTVTATVGGVDDGADATCTFSVSGGAMLVDNGDCTASVTCTGEGDFTVSVVAGDSVCTPSATASLALVCAAGGGRQLPGDCNQDGRLDISDGVCLVNVLFLGIPQDAFPCGDGASTDPGNLTLLDWNDEFGINITDAVYALNWLFLGGPQHVLGRACISIEGCPDNVGCP